MRTLGMELAPLEGQRGGADDVDERNARKIAGPKGAKQPRNLDFLFYSRLYFGQSRRS